MLIEMLLWFCVAFVLYAYFGYPLVLLVISLFKNCTVKKGNITPKVSFIITVHNEEKRIRDKIENTLQQQYPREKLEIIVASDGSDDLTEAIVRTYKGRGVRCVGTPERRGKEYAQKKAIETAKGEILVFSDVATILEPDGVSHIAGNFNDATVGCVSSLDRFIDQQGRVGGEGAYVRYEMLLRLLETRTGSLVGLSGSFFAARREVCADWAPHLPSDFNTVINSIKSGLRGVLDEEAIGFYKTISDDKKEFARKQRTVIRGIAVLMKNPELLDFTRYGLFSWQLFSHKLCRWVVPFALAGALLANPVLAARSQFYLFILIFQGAFYAVALLGMHPRLLPKWKALTVPSFFVLVNLSIVNAWYRYARGERIVSWEPSQR